MSRHIRNGVMAWPALLALAALGLSDTPPGAARGRPITNEIVREVDEYLTRLSGFGFSGVVLIARPEGVLLKKGYGLANDEQGFAQTPATVADIGSLAKHFTAAAVLVLEQQGKLKTSDSLSAHLPGVPDDKKAITLAQLLSHSSGLGRDFPLKDPSGPYYEEVDRDEAIRRILKMPLAGEPGKAYAYSNVGYILLAAIVERVANQPFREFLSGQLFKPAGMASTGFWGSGLPPVPNNLLARSYDDNVENGNLRKLSATTWMDLGGGEIVSTAEDLHRWWMALQGTQVLSDGAKKKMFAPNLGDYGFGCWIQKTRRGTTLIQHGGDYLGFGAQFAWFRDEGILVVTLANRSNQHFGSRHVANRIVPQILFGERPYRMFAKDEFDMPPASKSADAELAARAAGTYQLATGGRLVIESDRGRLQIGGLGQDAIDELTGATDAERRQRAMLNDAAKAVVEGASRGDTKPLAQWLRPGGPVESYAGTFRETFGDAARKNGPLQSIEVVGTAPGAYPVGVVRTMMRLNGKTGFDGLQVNWLNDRIVGLLDAPRVAALTPLRADERGGLVAWSIIWFRGVQMSLDGKDLVLRHNDRQQVARRLP